MGTKRSDKAYEWWLHETTRFDYFVLGACLALVGYLASILEPARVGLNAQTAELVSISSMLAAAFAGFKRIEALVVAFKLSHDRLYALEATGALRKASQNPGRSLNTETGDVMTPQEALREAHRQSERAQQFEDMHASWASGAARWYVVRNTALLFGMASLVAARVWRAYG